MEACFYLFIIFAIFAFGDILGVLSKAKISGIFIVMVVFIIGYLSGVIPDDIFDRAGALATVAGWAVPFVIVNLGSGINVRQLLDEWRSVVVCLIAMAAAAAGLMLVSPIIGKESAIVSIPIINGGVFATQIMTAAAAEKHATMAVALGLLVFSVQKLVGAPLASRFGSREAVRLLEEYRKDPEYYKAELQKSEAEKNAEAGKPVKKKFYEKFPNFYRLDSLCLMLTALLAFIACWLGEKTGLNASVWALLLGVFARELGIIQPHILDQAKSTGILIIAMWGALIPSLASIKISEILTCAWQLVVIFAAAVLAMFVACYFLPTWKIVRSKDLAMGISMCQLIGFPATMLITKEVSMANGQTEDEQEFLMSRLTPPYVISGMVSVTTLSIVIAGILCNFL
jgi:hypothetical protein